ncbi:hypothetical protein ACA910_020216 [Epithemia clementina (nom. ined.)]
MMMLKNNGAANQYDPAKKEKDSWSSPDEEQQELTTSVVESKIMTSKLSCLRRKRSAASILNKENDVANEKSNSSSSKTKRGSNSTNHARILPPMKTIPVETYDPLAAADEEPLSDSRRTVSTMTTAAAVLQAPSSIPLHDDSIRNVANPLWCMTVVYKLNLPTIIKGPFSFSLPTHSALDKETKDADGVKCSSWTSSSSSSSSSSMSVSSLPDLGEPPNTTTTTTKACATTTTASKNKRTTVKPATKRSKKASMTTSTTTTTSTTISEPNNPHQHRYEPDILMSKEELKQWQLQLRRMRNLKSAAASRQKTRQCITKLEEQ